MKSRTLIASNEQGLSLEPRLIDTRIERHIRELLRLIGEDPTRGGLTETPARVRKAWSEWTKGYGMDPSSVLKTFEDDAPAPGSREMLVVHDVPVYSHCEHHLTPFFGSAHIGYIPNGRIVGLSKLPRLVDIFARRLQVQERLTEQIAQALQDALNPVGVGVFVRCRHLCMESRGIRARGASTETAAYRGTLSLDRRLRAEFVARCCRTDD